MKYLLDTCVISELIKPQPNDNVINWIGNIHETELFISAFTVGEIRKGIDKLENSKYRQKLNRWFQEIMEWSEHRILSFDKIAAKNCGTLLAQCELKGRPIPVIDSMIAALALTYECTLVTRNINDFANIDIAIINPFLKES